MTIRTLSPEQIAALEAQFDVIDQNSDGRITADEVASLLSREAYAHLGPVERQRVLDSFAKADADADGMVDFDEFLTMMADQPDPRAVFREGFDALDLDGDGLLTAADFKRVSELKGAQLTTEQADALVQMADANQDGVVSFEEYYAIMTAGSSG
jgi:Ca2+-binding EF-hand superfamily protein